ncbi:ArsR/SmtB family transcription factor [Streptomyces cinnamoneus]|uniref:ArsR/SmtB family transcription factor n=1 Tax=Streptomyces cinnamoneus TaxID=53446 RepID=UPI001EFE91E8|nr:helix-turn-helix transcriptional regulator [Streptomyces cinnamoneus]
MQTPNPSRSLAHPETGEIRLEGVLHALSDPMRLLITQELAAAGEAELSCSVFDLPVSKSTTTHHFRVLRESGVVRQVYRGTAKMNSLRRDDLDALFPGLLDSVLSAHAAQTARLGDARA